MDAKDQTISRLNQRIEELEEVVRQMRGSLERDVRLAGLEKVGLQLTATEKRYLLFLIARFGVITSSAKLYDWLYSDRPDKDAPDPKVIDVYICKLRKELRPIGVKIETVWGQGYRLSRASIDLLNGLNEERAA